ncbi:MAG: tetratricopeptide repeat protein [Elusimicrobia bacterium]|nr:tetratricopeptide repeat protein [Elusimicrobiota bacterium]
MKRGLILVGLALALSGCVATQNDVLDMENQTANLRVQIQDLQQTISSMQANQADLSTQMGQLHDTLSAFTDAINSYQTDMNRLSSKMDDLNAAISSRVESIGTQLTQAQAQAMAQAKADLAKQAQAVLNSPTELFNQADIRLSLQDYGLAAEGFSEYVRKFPQGALIDAATYKLGQAYYGEGKWEDAGRQFALILEKYPKSSMIPQSRLMYAMSLLRIGGRVDEAKKYLESIPSDFPGTPEARRAQLELRELARHHKKPRHSKKAR